MIENIPKLVLDQTFNLADELVEQKYILMEGLNLLLSHSIATGDKKAKAIITNTLTKLYNV